MLGDRPLARILLEASTEREWVARHVESLGHEVIVADPNDGPMYANRSRRTKTDTRDARTLMDACETGAWRPASRRSEARRHVRAELAVRDALVGTRTRDIALAKALVRRDGLRVPTSASAWVPTRIAALDLSPTLTAELAPLFAVFAPLNAQIAVADARLAAFAKDDPIATRLTTAVCTWNPECGHVSMPAAWSSSKRSTRTNNRSTARRNASVNRAVSCAGHVTNVPSGRKPPSVTRRCRCGCQLAREPCACKQATIPTARSRSPVSVRMAAVTVRVATRAISPSRRRWYRR